MDRTQKRLRTGAVMILPEVRKRSVYVSAGHWWHVHPLIDMKTLGVSGLQARPTAAAWLLYDHAARYLWTADPRKFGVRRRCCG